MATIRLRRGTAAQWISANPTLVAGEQGYETDTGKVKIGDGSTPWITLGYATPPVVATAVPWAASTAYVAGDIRTYNAHRYACLTAHTSTSTFDTTKWALLPTASADVARGPLGYRPIAKSNYQGVTYRKAAIAIRHDDGQKTDLAIAALEKARGITAGYAIPSSYVGAAAGTVVDPANGGVSATGQMTSADLLALQADGFEIMHHSTTHNSAPTTWADFVAETETGRKALAALGLYPDNFVPPGPWTGTPKFAFTGEGHYDTPEGALLRQSFAACDGYIDDGILSDSYRRLPGQRLYGASHMTGETMTSGQLQVYVDNCIKYGLGLEMLFHTWTFDTASHITTADYTTFLDYLKTKRDAGLLDILTPTGLLYATQADARTNLLRDGTFQEQSTVGWWEQTGSPSVVASGGHDSGNGISVTSANYVVQRFAAFGRRPMRFEAWVKAASGTCLPRAIVRATNAAESFNWTSQDNKRGSTDTTGARVAFNFGGHPSATQIKVWLFAEGASANNVVWSDVKVFPI